MIQLNEFQFMLLQKLANARSKIYAMVRGVPSDKYRERIDEDFESTKALVDMNLCADVTALPKYDGLREQYMVDEGREMLIIEIGPVGQRMFERQKVARKAKGIEWVN